MQIVKLHARFGSIRFIFIRSHLFGMFLTTVTLLSVLLTIHVLFHPDWLTVTAIFVFIFSYVLLAIIISFYAGFRSSGDLKERLDYISLQIIQFSNGNYDSRVYFKANDEILRISNELNELGEKLKNQVTSLRRLADEKADFAKSAHKAAVIEERQRLARDLHDAVSQQLFALTMMSEAAVKQIEKDPRLAKQQMEEVARAALHSQSEMRALLLHLRPVHLSGDSLASGVEKLISELRRKSQIEFIVSLDSLENLPETVEEHVFRIIQEALSNILRHANASTVKLQIHKRNTELFVHIGDNGIGFDLEQKQSNKTSYGLKTMRERSEELGGHFSVRSIQKEGTYIEIRIPYKWEGTK